MASLPKARAPLGAIYLPGHGGIRARCPALRAALSSAIAKAAGSILHD